MRSSLVSFLFLVSLSASGQDFRPEAIRGHMQFLASDLLEGRGTGTRGYQVAADYVATQFEAAGLSPGVTSSYFQTIPFRKTVPGAQSSVTFTPDGATPVILRFSEGFTTTGNPLQKDSTVEGQIVIVGYGVTAPELKHDDYAGLDVRGKIVGIFSGAPSTFADSLRAHYSNRENKLQNAVDHGAAGIIQLSSRTDVERAPWDRVVRQSKLGAMHWLRADGTSHAVRAQIPNTVSLSTSAAEGLFAKAPRSFHEIADEVRKGGFRGFELPVRASIRTLSSHERVESANVVGVIRGSDPALRDEYLVYSAHLDHVGIVEPVDGDSINNGAFDNASGIAAIIEIARAFGSRKAPKRSIIFLATTGEEKGLRGADYFANNPTVPIDQLVGNINIDQIMMLHALKDIVPLGIEVSTLGDMARKVAKKMGVEISKDPNPEEVYFVRSDQYAFVKRGVPAIYVGSGYKAVDPNIESEKEQMAWVKAIYHTPKDDLNQKIDYSVGSMLARFNYLLGLEVANNPAPPAWTPGNFFGEKFGRR